MNNSTIRIIKRAPVTILIMIGFLFALSLFQASSSRRVIFRARIGHNFPERTYRGVSLGQNRFVTGMDGQVFWNAKSFTEAFVLTTIVDDDSVLQLFDILFLLILNIILFWMVRDITADNFFSEKILTGFQWFGRAFILYMLKGVFIYHLSKYLLDGITDGQLTAVLKPLSLMPYIILSSFFQLLPSFINKARQIQKEQELTI